MVDIATLVSELNAAANKAALCRDIGDYFGATYWEGRCREIDEHIIRHDALAALVPEDGYHPSDF